MVWLHFVPAGKPYAICQLCGEKKERYNNAKFERYLKSCHKKEVEEIMKKIVEAVKCIPLANYFHFNIELFWIVCISCKKSFNCFLGIDPLWNNVRKCCT